MSESYITVNKFFLALHHHSSIQSSIMRYLHIIFNTFLRAIVYYVSLLYSHMPCIIERWSNRTDDQLALLTFLNEDLRVTSCSRRTKPHDRKQTTRKKKPEKTSSLLTLARRDSWQAVAKFAPSYTVELVEKDANGLIPLHVACRCVSICRYVLRSLVEAAPHTTRLIDNEGSTPLHFLLHYGSPNDEVLRFMIDAYPQALAVRDIYGQTPLFHAIEKNLSLSGVKIIMEYLEASESILKYCGPGLLGKYQDPISSRGSLVHQSVYRLSEIDTERTLLYFAWRNTLTPLDGSDFKMKGKRWEKAMLLLKVAYSRRHPSAKFRLLHALLEFLPYLPLDIHDFLFTISQGDIEQPEDGSGRLPLHIVSSLDMDDNEVLYLIQKLLHLHPEAIRHKALNGRLPFHEAIATGKSLRVCMRLFKEYQAAMEAVDDMTGLYPFMLAAPFCSTEDDQTGTIKNTNIVKYSEDSAPTKDG